MSHRAQLTVAETVMPDFSNTGVIFRSLLAVNAAVLIVCMVQANGLLSGVVCFAESAMLVELSCLISLFVLSAVRRILFATGRMHSLSFWAQRGLCMLVPAVVAGGLIQLLSFSDGVLASFSHVSFTEGVLLAGLFGFLLQHYFELRARAFSPALAEAKLQALQARIRPHFLFNSLNAVLSLIRKEPLRAEVMLEDMAELFRMSMRDARTMTTLDEEIRLCQQYLSIEGIRLGERLQVEWDTSGIADEDLRQTRIASLLLQPLLENAVHYGVEPAAVPTLIQVRIARLLDRIEIVIANPVAPETPSNGNQMALSNIRERLTLLYDVEAKLVSREVEGRFEVYLRFPFERGTA